MNIIQHPITNGLFLKKSKKKVCPFFKGAFLYSTHTDLILYIYISLWLRPQQLLTKYICIRIGTLLGLISSWCPG